MMTKNVYYATQPEKVIVYTTNDKALIEFPIEVTKVENDDEALYHAKMVYSIETKNTPSLKDRVEKNYDAWLKKAKESEAPSVTMQDVLEAINTLTDLVIGG